MGRVKWRWHSLGSWPAGDRLTGARPSFGAHPDGAKTKNEPIVITLKPSRLIASTKTTHAPPGPLQWATYDSDAGTTTCMSATRHRSLLHIVYHAIQCSM